MTGFAIGIVAVFIIGYAFIALESVTKVNKAAIALLMCVIENLVTKADKILIGGGMAFTFLRAKGLNIGKSILDEENVEFCKNILEKYPDKIVLPSDVVVTKEFSNDVPFNNTLVENILDDDMGMDIGENTIVEFSNVLDTARVVFWNGPLGLCKSPKECLKDTLLMI